MKNNQPSLIDVFLTNSPTLLCNTINFNSGLSDCHDMILTSFKESCISNKRQKITFRSYRRQISPMISIGPFSGGTVFEDASDCYWAYETLQKNIQNKILHCLWTLNYANLFVRGKMLHNKYLKYKSRVNWERYRKQEIMSQN